MSKTAFLFPGQGSQFIGMGREYNDRYLIARRTFDEANDVLGYDLRKICFEGNLMKLNSIENTLPAILTVSVATFRVFMEEFEIVPDYLAGHSLGEYSALTCSGGLDFSDALKLVRKRSILAQVVLNENRGTMSIIDGVDSEIVDKVCIEVSKISGRVITVF